MGICVQLYHRTKPWRQEKSIVYSLKLLRVYHCLSRLEVLNSYWSRLEQGTEINAAHYREVFFTARTTYEKAVRPSVCPSVKRVHCDRKEKNICPDFLYHKKDHLAYSFLRRRWLVGATPSTWNLGQADAVGAKSPIFSRYSLVAYRISGGI